MPADGKITNGRPYSARRSARIEAQVKPSKETFPADRTPIAPLVPSVGKRKSSNPRRGVRRGADFGAKFDERISTAQHALCSALRKPEPASTLIWQSPDFRVAAQEIQVETAPIWRVEVPDGRRTHSNKRSFIPQPEESDRQPRAKRARLTRGNLALLNQMVRKNKAASDLTPGASERIGGTFSTTKTVSTTASGFAEQAAKNGIIVKFKSRAPINLEEICHQHNAPRQTASPPESQYEEYLDKVDNAKNEFTLQAHTCGMLLKYYTSDDYSTALNQSFTAFPPEVGFNNGLSAPQPDFLQGPQAKSFAPFPAKEILSGAVLYKDDHDSLTLPHIAGEWKIPSKGAEAARLQSAYDGAALVYARHQALAHIGTPDPVGHAAVTTFTTNGCEAHHFAHFATPRDDDSGEMDYHQYLYARSNLIDSHQEYQKGRRGLRNQQDRAKRVSEGLRSALLAHHALSYSQAQAIDSSHNMSDSASRKVRYKRVTTSPPDGAPHGEQRRTSSRACGPDQAQITTDRSPQPISINSKNVTGKHDIGAVAEAASSGIIDDEVHAPTPPLPTLHKSQKKSKQRSVNERSTRYAAGADAAQSSVVPVNRSASCRSSARRKRITTGGQC